MNRPELYNKKVDILYQAYFNDTLEHADCAACAVGNILLANGVPPAKNNDITSNGCYNNTSWKGIFYTVYIQNWGDGSFIPGYDRKNAIKAIRQSGYKVKELARIEYAFEKVEYGKCREDYMFNGLSAVLEVLKQIHEVTDEDLLQANNKRFADHYKLKTAAV